MAINRKFQYSSDLPHKFPTMTETAKAEIKQRIKEKFIAWSPGEGPFSADHVAGFYDRTEQYFAFDTLMPTTCGYEYI